MPQRLIDLSNVYQYDNPFDDVNKKKIFENIIDKTLSMDFESMSENIHYWNLDNNINCIYGDTTKMKTINETSLAADMKDTICNIQELKYFNNWLNGFNINTTDENNDENEIIEENNEENIETVEENNEITTNNETTNNNNVVIECVEDEPIIPIQPGKFDYSKTGGLTNYDISSEKPMSYDDIRKLTVNIARSKLKKIIEKSEQVLALEKEKRKELMNNIQKYRNIKAIGALVEDDIVNMNIQQLENTLNQCEKLYQSQKLKEIIKRGSNFGSLITSTIFPNGIKFGGKQLKMKGTAKTIIDNIFDTQSTMGVAFQNIIDKHNWHITDEAVLMLSIGEMLIGSVKIEDVPKENNNFTNGNNNTSNNSSVSVNNIGNNNSMNGINNTSNNNNVNANNYSTNGNNNNVNNNASNNVVTEYVDDEYFEEEDNMEE